MTVSGVWTSRRANDDGDGAGTGLRAGVGAGTVLGRVRAGGGRVLGQQEGWVLRLRNVTLCGSGEVFGQAEAE